MFPLRTVEQDVKSLLDRFRAANLSRIEGTDALATLIFLRLVDAYDAEQESRARPGSSNFVPFLREPFRWRDWSRKAPEELRALFTRDFLIALNANKGVASHWAAAYLAVIAPACERLGRMSHSLLSDITLWLTEKRLDSLSDRQHLLEVFDGVFGGGVSDVGRIGYIPDSVASLVASIADPKAGERVYDPCFGAAGLLGAVFERTFDHANRGQTISGEAALRVFGVERDSFAYLVGLTRLLLSGVSEPQLEFGDWVERSPMAHSHKNAFDLVVAAPPWTQRVESWRNQNVPVPTSDATGLYIQHILSALHPKGRAVVVVPEGFLSRGDPDRRLREHLLERFQVDAVVGMPENVFLPVTQIRTCVLVLRRNGPTERVRMVDGANYFDLGSKSSAATLSAASAEQIAKVVHGQSSPEAWYVGRSEVAAVDWDLTTRRRAESMLQELLEGLRPGAEVVTLAQCCDVGSGAPVGTRDVLTEPDEAETIPFVQLNDIQQGTTGRISRWLRRASVADVESKRRLLAGDVLFSRSGTAAKIGVVGNSALGGLAAVGLYSLRPDPKRLDPNYLFAYLHSDASQNWLRSRASGGSMQIFHSSLLRDLPMPLPTLALQRRAADEFRSAGTDVLVFLRRFYELGSQDPVAEWISGALSDLPATADAISSSLPLTRLERLSETLQPVRNSLTHDAQASTPLKAWAVSLADCLQKFANIGAVPKGPGLLSLLREVLRNLDSTKQLIQGSLAADTQARALNDLLERWINRAIAELVDDVKLRFSIGKYSLSVGAPAELRVIVANVGTMPVRDVTVSSSPDWGNNKIPYLAEGRSAAIVLRGVAPSSPGIIAIGITWAARTLEGRPLKGERQLSLQVAQGAAFGEHEDLGGSPYVCGDPIAPNRSDVFFGRESLLEQISRQIIDSGNVVLLEGNRRAGKTSILRHLEGKTRVPGWLGVYCSLQGAEGASGTTGVPTVEVFRAIATSLAKALHSLGIDTPLPNGTLLPANKPALGVALAVRKGIDEESPYSQFQEYLELVLKLLAKSGLGMFLMLDEFDKLQEGIEHGITSPQVPENLRYLVQHYPRFSAILTGSKRLKRLREEYWSALYGMGTRFGVSSLPVEAARQLVTEPVRGKLVYSPEAIERAIKVTAGQPYLLQCLCNRIFDLASQSKIRSITIDIVDDASDAFVKDNEHFASLWGYAKTDRRRLILAILAKGVAGLRLLTLGALHEELTQVGVESSQQALVGNLEHLRELEIIDFVPGVSESFYRLTIPLMGAWIEQHHDFDAIRSRAQAETEINND
jgi:type I restriction enzyme M protein